ncbi:MAG: flavodoxin family protein [Chloroflexi bacterium]|nr:flavodoxin family protein [Chloroflexota bacterium]
MGKAVIVYESKYGNTRLVAEAIAEGMEAVSGEIKT